jgi:hypothetical protein
MWWTGCSPKPGLEDTGCDVVAGADAGREDEYAPTHDHDARAAALAAA